MSGNGSFDLFEVVRFYVQLGLRVLPVWGVDESGLCLCHVGATCPSAGKHPIPSNGLHGATTDLRELEAYWRSDPRANVGIATSAEFSILDIDAKNGGLGTFAALEKQYGADTFQSPYRVRTGGGGLHIAFRSPPGTRSRNPLLPGIDYKAEGGMIVAPYSKHASREFYRFESPHPNVDLSMLRLLPAELLASRTTVQPGVTTSSGKIGLGRRNITLTSIAGKLREKGIGGAEIEAALRSLNQIVCETPLLDAELQRLVSSVARYAAGVQPAITFIGADELVAAVPPQVQWVVPGLVALGSITELSGQPKEAGKSTLIRAMVSAILTGAPFLGMPTMRCSVLMLSEERDGSLSYALAQQGIALPSLRLLQRHRIAGPASWPEIVEASVAEMGKLGAKVLVVDTLSHWALGDSDENSASDALKAMDPLLRAAAEGISIIIVRHMRKSGGETVTAARGSSAITGATDIVCTLGHHSAGDTFRVIDATGRFKESIFKLVIELTPSGYIAHGNGQQVAQQAQQALEDLILSLLPQDEASALTQQDLLGRLAGTSKPIGRTKLAEVLKELVKSGGIKCTGAKTRTNPARYWAP